MKKILFFFALLTLAIGAGAQTQVSILPSNEAGRIETYQSISEIHYDSVGNPTDTAFLIGHYDYRAIANPGYRFEKWEVITTYNAWYDVDSNQWIDSVYNDTIIQPNIEITETDTIDYAGWLEWELGIPDLSCTDSLFDSLYTDLYSDITSITINAYFVSDSSVGIGEVTPQSYQLYPNPTTGTIRLQGDIQQVQVYDATGRRVLKTSQRTVNITGQPAGIYIIHITNTTGKTSITRVIKQ